MLFNRFHRIIVSDFEMDIRLTFSILFLNFNRLNSDINASLCSKVVACTPD